MSSTQELNSLPSTHRTDAQTNWASQAAILDRYTEKHLLSFLSVGLGDTTNIYINTEKALHFETYGGWFLQFCLFLLAKVKGQKDKY